MYAVAASNAKLLLNGEFIREWNARKSMMPQQYFLHFQNRRPYGLDGLTQVPLRDSELAAPVPERPAIAYIYFFVVVLRAKIRFHVKVLLKWRCR